MNSTLYVSAHYKIDTRIRPQTCPYKKTSVIDLEAFHSLCISSVFYKSAFISALF